MTASPTDPLRPDANRGIYGLDFWLAFTANLLLISANSLTFRFAEFIAAVGAATGRQGGTEEISGWIISIGMAAALVMRLWLGQGIDRYGARAIWLMSSLLYLSGCLAFLIPAGLSPVLWFARIAYQVGLAGMFSCSMVNIQNQVPPSRRTEVIGSLGTSGFVGIVVGTQLGDVLFHRLDTGNPLIWFGSPRFNVIFGLSAIFGLLHMLVVLYLTHGDIHRRPEETPHALQLLFRYWPGGAVWAAIAHGIAFSVTTVFLTRYATELNLRGIGPFFLGYAIIAFISRWLTRDWGEKIGRHQMLLRGLFSMMSGLFLLLPVRSDWMLLPSALACGFGAALIFPPLLSLGAGRFPPHYRGTGTTLVLGFIDLGTIIASPILGTLIDYGNTLGERLSARSPTASSPFQRFGFTLMFVAAGGSVGLVLLYYWLIASRRPDVDPHEEDTLAEPLPTGLSAAPPALADPGISNADRTS